MLQETHGDDADFYELGLRFPGWLIYGSGCPNPVAGGVIIFLKKFFLKEATNITFQVLDPGRISRVVINIGSAVLNLFNIHSDPRASVETRKDLLRKAFSSSAPELGFLLIAAGDFNITLPGDARLDLQSMVLQPADDYLGKWFACAFPFLTVIDHPGYTRAGTVEGTLRYLATLDYVFTDLPRAEILDRHPVAVLLVMLQRPTIPLIMSRCQWCFTNVACARRLAGMSPPGSRNILSLPGVSTGCLSSRWPLRLTRRLLVT